jgi:hypothetical protein
VHSASNSAARDKGRTGALYSKNSDPAAGVGMALFTTALDLYGGGGVLWRGELQGFIVHEMMPSAATPHAAHRRMPRVRKKGEDTDPIQDRRHQACQGSLGAPLVHRRFRVSLVMAVGTTRFRVSLGMAVGALSEHCWTTHVPHYL